jgi:hypothetical protein
MTPDRSPADDFEEIVARVSADLVDVVRLHLARGVDASAVLEALAQVLGTAIGGTADSVDEAERQVEIASLRVQQSVDDTFVSKAGGL